MTETATPASFAESLRGLGDGPLTEAAVRAHVFPLFGRVLERNERTGEIYLANHSLGRPPDRMADDVRTAVDLWYRDMDLAWAAWSEEERAYRARVAALIGCGRGDAVVPKTSAAQGLRAVLNALPRQPPVVLTTTAEFDSIDHVLRVYEARGRLERRVVAPDADELAAATPGVDLVVVSQVLFVTGRIVEHLDRVIEAARRANALTLIDTYHAAGVIDVGFDRLGPDFAIGGNYKYTRGGPGACWLAVHPRHLTSEPTAPEPGVLAPIDTGWFARPDPMAFDRDGPPALAAGGDGWLEATPPVLTFFQARAGLELTLAIGVERLRAYNLDRQARLIEALRAAGVEPAAFEPRGASLLADAADPRATAAALRDRGVVVDGRRDPCTGRGYVRFGPDLLTTEAEILQAADRAAAAIRS